MELLKDILLQKEPEWMASKVEFGKILEHMLFEALRTGMSAHLGARFGGAFDEYNQLMALTRHALGKYF